MVIKNTLLNEIKILYPKEFQIGLYAKALIQGKLGIEIPEDEVGYIALHIHTVKINAGEMSETLDITAMIRDCGYDRRLSEVQAGRRYGCPMSG